MKKNQLSDLNQPTLKSALRIGNNFQFVTKSSHEIKVLSYLICQQTTG